MCTVFPYSVGGGGVKSGSDEKILLNSDPSKSFGSLRIQIHNTALITIAAKLVGFREAGCTSVQMSARSRKPVTELKLTTS
jgi:hypothetical protein